MKIEIMDVIERLIDRHYVGMHIDWRLIDSVGDTPIESDLLRASIIRRQDFIKYMLADGFIGCIPTVKGKWLALMGSGVICNYSKKTDTAVIDLTAVKNSVSKWKRIPFSASLYAEKEKEKNKKKVSDSIIYAEGSE